MTPLASRQASGFIVGNVFAISLVPSAPLPSTSTIFSHYLGSTCTLPSTYSLSLPLLAHLQATSTIFSPTANSSAGAINHDYFSPHATSTAHAIYWHHLYSCDLGYACLLLVASFLLLPSRLAFDIFWYHLYFFCYFK